ncbi:MAG: hypothetical protein JXB88_13630 [Spirochaetales bacterium]|nr:hypothetical protein [Spirochaetales bacterium]
MTTVKHIISEIVHPRQKTRVEAGQFFISWNGVPTLAYRGFSPVLLDIKKEITTRLPCLKKENSGSKWPKTTLGALRDERTLSMDDLFTLRDICDSMNPLLQNLTFKIDKLDIVIFYCRSLEQRLLTAPIPLAGQEDTTPPPWEHLDKVSATMKQFARDCLSDYLPVIQKPGNRESHYRDPFIEATLIYDLEDIPEAVTKFREKVDQELPGMYCWFDDKSLHMTVRALAGSFQSTIGAQRT